MNLLRKLAAPAFTVLALGLAAPAPAWAQSDGKPNLLEYLGRILQPKTVADSERPVDTGNATVSPPPAISSPLPGSDQRRVALVIGNATYKQSPLANPVNDARAMAARLRKLGFDVDLRENIKTRDIGNVYRQFRTRIAPGDAALIFYAGHGVQIKGSNYFPAVDADINSEEDVPLQSLNLGTLLDNMEEAKAGVSLVLLDACRDNPFMRRFRSASRGLAKAEAASGTLIHYATKPGSVAADGEGKNGTYTEALLAQIEEPGVPVELMLKRVTNKVVSKTQGRQEPWVEGSLRGEFFFNTKVAAATAVPLAAAAASPAPAVAPDPETQTWLAAEASQSAAGFSAYLDAYPQGRYAAAARIKVTTLTPVAPVPAPTPAFAPSALPAAAPAPMPTLAAAPSAVSPAPTSGAGKLPLATTSQPAASTVPPRPGRSFRDCPDCPEMLVLPAGSFQMGSPLGEAGRDDAEGPQRPVSVRSFALGRSQVTRAQFAAFVQATGHPSPPGCHVWNGTSWLDTPGRGWAAPDFAQDDNHPAVCINWPDARAYVEWLASKTGRAYRLPSEAEWEYAARAGGTGARYWGQESDSACDYANVLDKSARRQFRYHSSYLIHQCMDDYAYTAPVARFKPNDFGLYDMLGNVWHWTADCWNDSHADAPADGSARSKGACSMHVLRGGSWNSPPRSVRAAFRARLESEVRFGDNGFRVARSLP